MGDRPRGRWLAGLAVLLTSGCGGLVGTDIPVGSWLYPEIRHLGALGALEEGSPSTQPLGRLEAARLLLQAGEAAGPCPGTVLHGLEPLRDALAMELEDAARGSQPSYWQPLEGVFLRHDYLSADGETENDRGRTYRAGSNLRVGFSSRFALGPLCGYAAWEGRWLENGGWADRLEEGYVKLSNGRWFILYGRQALWWGPGYHGALLVSDNARPFDLVRWGNEEPFLPPQPLAWLGPTRIEFFWTELEEDRVIPRANLAGMRLSVMPRPWLELGASRTAIYGGEGRPVDWRTIWDLLTARNENTPEGPGDQLASLYWRLRVRWPAQPFEFYGEYGGEDEAGGFFAKNAVIVGLYLPRLGRAETLDFRVEYADTYFGGHDGTARVWYQHGIYQSGYTYQGRVIGHHAGTDATDLYLEAGYRPLPGLRLSVHLDFERRELSLPAPERHYEYGLRCQWHKGRGLQVEARYAHEDIANYGFAAGTWKSTDRVTLRLGWLF